MQFPIVGFLLLGCASLSSCESTHPKLAAVDKKVAKDDAEADLDALDAAVNVVDKRLVKTEVKKESKTDKVAVKKVVKKAHKTHHVAPKPPSKMPEVDISKSPMFQKDKNLVVSKEAEAVLAKGDAKAHELEETKHEHEMEKVAPAKVVHVASAKVKGDAVVDAKDLESDLHDLKNRIVADAKHAEEVKKEEAEEKAEKAAKKPEEKVETEKPQKQADLNKLQKLSEQMVSDAKPASTPKVFLQQEPKDGIRAKSGIDSAAADLEATAQELESHPHMQKKPVAHTKPKPADQQFGALSHLKDSILKAKQAQETKAKEEHAEKAKRLKAQAEANEDAEALSGTVPAFGDPRLKEVKVTHVQHLSPTKLKNLKNLVGKMQDSVYVEPEPVKNMITDLKSNQEAVVGDPTVHMLNRDGFGERKAPLPKLPPAPRVLPKLPMAPPKPTPKAPQPKPVHHVAAPPQPPHHNYHAAHQESPLAPTVVATKHAQAPTAPVPAPKKPNPVEENEKKFEKQMHQNVVNMHAALRETVKATQEQLASQLAAKKRAEEAKLAREMQTAEEKRKKLEQKQKAAALRAQEETKAEAEKSFAHQQMLDYRTAQKKARALKEEQEMQKKKEEIQKKKEAERHAREVQAQEEVAREKLASAKNKDFGLHAEPASTSAITDSVAPQMRPSQFVASSAPSGDSPTHGSEVKAKGSAFTQTLTLSVALAVLCSW